MRGAIWIAAVGLWAACESRSTPISAEPNEPPKLVVAPSKPRKVGKPDLEVSAPAPVTAIAPTANRRSIVMVPALRPPSVPGCKPEPPIAVAIASHQLATDRYELIVTATPSAAVDSVALELVLPAGARADRVRQAFGTSRAGEARVLTAIVTTTAETTDLAAVARVPVDAGDRGAPIVMSRSTSFVLGTPHAQPITKSYLLPDGERAREVRP